MIYAVHEVRFGNDGSVVIVSGCVISDDGAKVEPLADLPMMGDDVLAVELQAARWRDGN